MGSPDVAEPMAPEDEHLGQYIHDTAFVERERAEKRERELLELLAAEWATAGALLFGQGVPSRSKALDAAKRALLAAMGRQGMSITDVADRLRTSRAVIRRDLHRLGLDELFQRARKAVGQ